ncbi:MAG: sulfotransferase domain-containing protein, partial [Gemmatimonadota bacterium]|nr:sulfotransferase domain-containing protein [Gemmatimonadota bacterium]
RMISQYVTWTSSSRENRPIETALLDEEENLYVARSRYWMQLSRYLEYFDRERILVVQSERLLHDRLETLREIFRFLGVSPDFSAIRFAVRRHGTSRKRRKTDLGLRLDGSRFMKALRRVPNRYRWPVEDALFYPVSRRIARPAISVAARAHLIERLREDVSRLRESWPQELDGWADRDFPAGDAVVNR